MEESPILGAGRWRTARAVTLPLVAPAILAGALVAFVNAIALFGSQAIIGLPGRIFTLPTRIYALFDHPPRYGLASALSLVFVAITVVALALRPLPGPAPGGCGRSTTTPSRRRRRT
jgi:iron(III) transport system permease protein